jgi:hypothetical protein
MANGTAAWAGQLALTPMATTMAVTSEKASGARLRVVSGAQNIGLSQLSPPRRILESLSFL